MCTNVIFVLFQFIIKTQKSNIQINNFLFKYGRKVDRENEKSTPNRRTNKKQKKFPDSKFEKKKMKLETLRITIG